MDLIDQLTEMTREVSDFVAWESSQAFFAEFYGEYDGERIIALRDAAAASFAKHACCRRARVALTLYDAESRRHVETIVTDSDPPGRIVSSEPIAAHAPPANLAAHGELALAA